MQIAPLASSTPTILETKTTQKKKKLEEIQENPLNLKQIRSERQVRIEQ